MPMTELSVSSLTDRKKLRKIKQLIQVRLASRRAVRIQNPALSYSKAHGSATHHSLKYLGQGPGSVFGGAVKVD
jgi:hypothetical protein